MSTDTEHEVERFACSKVVLYSVKCFLSKSRFFLLQKKLFLLFVFIPTVTYTLNFVILGSWQSIFFFFCTVLKYFIIFLRYIYKELTGSSIISTIYLFLYQPREDSWRYDAIACYQLYIFALLFS